MTEPLIAITSYYNPFKGENRRRNYHVFRRNLGVPLVTVEWSRDGEFDLAPEDADILIQVRGGDLMWQKERLLNRGLERIRRDSLARDVLFIDADVVFADAQWVGKLGAALDAHPFAQAFSHVDYLPPLPAQMQTRDQARESLSKVTPEAAMPSLAAAVAQGKPIFYADPELARVMQLSVLPVAGNPGMATATRLEKLPANFALYEGNIVGGGDQAFLASVIGGLDMLFEHRAFTPAHQAGLRDWGKRCLPANSTLGCADNLLMHLWHGDLAGRQYSFRSGILMNNQYDPAAHLDLTGDALRFAETGAEGLKSAVADYLHSRDDA